jgi:hypothetical protein
MKSRGITATQANGSTWAILKLNYAEGSDVFLDTAANARTGIGAIDAAIKKVFEGCLGAVASPAGRPLPAATDSFRLGVFSDSTVKVLASPTATAATGFNLRYTQQPCN